MNKWRGASVAVLGLAATACAPPTILRDPSALPAVLIGAAGLGQRGPAPPPQPALVPLPVLQADLRATSGSDTIPFAPDAWQFDDAARRTLSLQADWLRANPMVRANIEGHADGRQTREHAFALAERRAAAVHSFLLAQGVPPAQLTIVSWGKERPATAALHDATWLQNSRVVTVLVR